MGLSNDVYAQISLVMLVGQLGKNAILIVEFAVQRRRDGLTLVEAAVEGGRSRFRPILMTSFAFIAGLDSAGLRHRGRGNRKPHHRHGVSRRNARGHLGGRLGHSRPLLLVRPDFRRAQTPRGRGG